MSPLGISIRTAAENVLELMARLNEEKGMTFIVATHNMQVAARATQIIELSNGQVKSEKNQA